MTNLKVKETKYKGYRFRSRLEAKWAVFFDACGVKWEYEPEGYDLGDELSYLPDFLLHGVTFNHAGKQVNCDLFVEVKGKMTATDAEKIRRFHKGGMPILVVGNIPEGANFAEMTEHMDELSWQREHENPDWPYFFNFNTVDDDYFSAYPGVDKAGVFNLFGADSNYIADADQERTARAYDKARQARFEFGEKGGKC